MQPSSGQDPYGFILKDGQKPARKFGLPKIHMTGHTKIVLGVLAAIFILIIVHSLGGNSKNTPDTNMATLGAQQTEILRVTKEATSDVQSPAAQNLDSTVATVFTSEQLQTAHYLAIKTTASQFNSFLNKNTDAQLQTASQNNNYDQTYLSYLKQALRTYQQNLQATLPKAAPGAQTLINGYLGDVQVLLADPQLKI